MPVALTASQAAVVRGSIRDCVLVQRFCVLSPSVRMMRYFVRFSVAYAAPCEKGRVQVGESIWNAQSRPIVTLVLPTAFMELILPCSVVGSMLFGSPQL